SDVCSSDLGLPAFQTCQLVALAADQGEPGHQHDDRRQQHAEHDLGLLRPRADVVEVQLAELHFLLLAHDAGPPAALAAASLSCACCAGSAGASGAGATPAPAS